MATGDPGLVLFSGGGPAFTEFLHPFRQIRRICIFLNIGALTKRALRARARYLNVNLARRNRDLQPGGTEIESLEEKSDSL